MKRLSDKARLYARSYGQPPYGQEIEGTADLLLQMADRLEEYEKLEEQGKLLKLPCANWMEIVFGDQEVFWGIDMDYTENPIREISVDNSERMTWYDGWETVVLKGEDENGLEWEFLPEEIGKTVFLTREEAEAVLKMN